MGRDKPATGRALPIFRALESTSPLTLTNGQDLPRSLCLTIQRGQKCLNREENAEQGATAVTTPLCLSSVLFLTGTDKDMPDLVLC